MIFTGERFIPEISGSIALEHWHRYVFSRELATGRRVLDVACGEGYGSAILAAVATRVAGVDIDERTIAQARIAYPSTNIDFSVAPCSKLPFDDATFDVAVSFETLEHVDAADQERMLSEIRRVLAPDGVLVISTPNKLVYTDRPVYHNPFHLQELYVEEFRTLVARFFPNVALYGQRVAASSFIFAEENAGAHGSKVEGPSGEFVDAATYVVAVCGSSRTAVASRSAYFNPQDDTMESMQAEVVRRERELRELQAEYAKLEGGYLGLLAENRNLQAARESRALATSPFRNAFAPLPSIDETTLDEERVALRSWIDRCRTARLESAQRRETA